MSLFRRVFLCGNLTCFYEKQPHILRKVSLFSKKRPVFVNIRADCPLRLKVWGHVLYKTLYTNVLQI